jgi:RyR domain/TrkA-N domain
MAPIYEELVSSWQGLGTSITNKLYFFYNHRKSILTALIVGVAALGFMGFYVSDKTNGFLGILNNTIGLFGFSTHNDNNNYLDVAKFLAIITVSFGALTLFFSQKLNSWKVTNVQRSDYILLIGLSDQNRNFLTNQTDPSSILVIEADKTHSDIDHFRQKGTGIITARAEEAIDQLNLLHLKKCIVSTGDDRRNIALAMATVAAVTTIQELKIYVRIDNRDFAVLFKQGGICSHAEKGIDIVPFSLYEIMCKQLFAKHSILGQYPEIIKTGEAYSIILVGRTKLIAELIYHLAILAHLPKQNVLTIYCIDAEADAFCSHIEKLYPGIREIQHLTLEARELDTDSLAFYTDPIWQTINLTNIIIATDDEEKNLDVAVNLQDTTFIKETTSGDKSSSQPFKTKVLFAMDNLAGLSEYIDNDKNVFKAFCSFGDLSGVSTSENLIDEKLDRIAKLIHYDYSGKLKHGLSLEDKNLQQAWLGAMFNDRESCRAQALHIDIKLLALELEKKRSDKAPVALLNLNQQRLNEQLTDRDLTDQMLETYSSKYFPNSFDTLFNKIARSEHNRWNAFHYLRGWQYNETKNKDAKQHDCLLPLEKFEADYARKTYKHDILSIVDIPKYLAYAKYEIVKTHAN